MFELPPKATDCCFEWVDVIVPSKTLPLFRNLAESSEHAGEEGDTVGALPENLSKPVEKLSRKTGR